MNSVFARLDIQTFFDSISRSKISRALRFLRIPREEAFELASLSTVSKEGGKRSLPFGFVQSPALSSLVLDRSALGRCLRDISLGKVALSVYMDDILVSGRDAAVVEAAVGELGSAAKQSGFILNAGKSQVGAPEITAFNLRLGHKMLEVLPERMTLFASTPRTTDGLKERAMVGYVATVNETQSSFLKGVLGLGEEQAGQPL